VIRPWCRLAAQLLARAARFEVLLPAFYVHCDPVLSEVLIAAVGASGTDRLRARRSLDVARDAM